GTEVNRVRVLDRRVHELDSLGTDQWTETLRATVEPPDFLLGNWFCDPAAYNPPKDSCPVWDFPETFQVALPGTFLDRFGTKPALGTPWRDGQEFPDLHLAAPLPGTLHFQDTPLGLAWEPGTDASATIRIRGRGQPPEAGSSAPWFELEVPDSGSATLDGAFLEGLEGPLELEVARVWELPLALGCPLGEGSGVTVLRAHRVVLELGVGAGVAFPDPPAPAAGWTEAEAIGQALCAEAVGPRPDIAAGPDAAVWIGWGAEGIPQLRVRDTTTGAWETPQVPEGSTQTYYYRGPVRLAAGEGRALIQFFLDDGAGGGTPVGYLVEPEQWLGGGTFDALGGLPRTTPVGAALLPDGSPLLAGVGQDLRIWYRLGDQAPGILVDALASNVAGTRAYALSDGTVSVVYLDGYYRQWIGDITDPAAGVIEATDLWLDKHYCAMLGEGDGLGHAHFLCGPDLEEPPETLHYATLPLSADGQDSVDLKESLDLPYLWFLEAFAFSRHVAAGPDGTVWVLFNVDCEADGCAVLFRRTPGGLWDGPFVPGHVTGEADLAVDPLGRVHLAWSARPFPGCNQFLPVYHSMMEVVP
ncbi:MAG: hypothetical protein FJ098_11355, partial [Deltaproteobacteria bacterium]|nr:hypothetical protein [Deltaproteobacteria bacterium]